MSDAAPLARERRLMVLITLLLVAVGLALASRAVPDPSSVPDPPPPHEEVSSLDGALVLTPVVRAPSMLTGLVADGDGGTYLLGKHGVIWQIDAAAGQVTPWLDLSDRVDDGGYEQGVRTALIVVPEPTGLALFKIACFTSAMLIRKQRG